MKIATPNVRFKKIVFSLLFNVCLFAAMSFAPKQVTEDEYYDVQWISTTAVGANYEWVWSIANPYPGNGTDGTLQDLSHWSLILPSCVTQANLVSAAYSLDGVNWTSMAANIAIDPSSQDAYTGPVMKFDRGFRDDQVMYYKLIVNAYYPQATSPAVFKSGRRTGSFVSNILGIGCEGGGESE